MKTRSQDKTNPRAVPRRSSLILHPLTLFVSVWGVSVLMYALHLSKLLTFTTGQVIRVALWIVVPFILAIFAFQLFCYLSPKKAVAARRHGIVEEEYLTRVDSTLNKWFVCWCALTIVEVVFSGGLPIIWLIRGSSNNYTTFGLPVLHVFLSSLLAVLALAKFGIYILLGGKRRLLIPAWLVVWSVAAVSRSIMVVALLQWGVFWFFLKGARVKTLLKGLTIGLVTIFIFGYVGDIRGGGADLFRALAQPSENYPSWLPSGFLWFYIYFTTPLSNLVNTSIQTVPLNSPLFPNTLYFLFPTLIRNLIYGDVAFGTGGDLVNESFNVSTAYIGPLIDYGYIGMALFSILLGVIAAFYWRRRQTFQDGMIYTIIAQCLVLSIFWDFLFYMPFLSQIFWIYFLLRTPKSSTKSIPVGLPQPSLPLNSGSGA
jgi:oligosaccharide repeat unit polymerase